MHDFFHMGGYAFYVWISYVTAALILLVNIVSPSYQHKQLLKKITRRLQRAERLK